MLIGTSARSAGTFVNGRVLHQSAASAPSRRHDRVGPLTPRSPSARLGATTPGLKTVASWLAEGSEPLPLPSPAGYEEKDEAKSIAIPLNEVGGSLAG